MNDRAPCSLQRLALQVEVLFIGKRGLMPTW